MTSPIAVGGDRAVRLARALLAPALMGRFLTLGGRSGFVRPVALAEDNRLTIALPPSRYGDMFEPPVGDAAGVRGDDRPRPVGPRPGPNALAGPGCN
ncbi:hypothetical protein [Sphingomonas sp.]|uniref:hypothetical protein n=1 Tax=Sphingomonas sp. TaxID=28214 RepID=UPI003B004512